MYESRTPPEKAPCGTCRVELMPENEAPVNVYLLCRNQIITRGMMGQIVDIDLNAIMGVMDRYPGGVKNQWDTLNKVRALFYHFKPEEGGE